MTFLSPNRTSIVLAPMEGVMDAPMRALIADLGGFDFGVSEFVRVGQEVVSAANILRDIPDLNGPVFGSARLPLQLQLLGDSPALMAGTAVEGCIAGARAIDLNFGCPAPTVLRRSGGAALLKTPCAITEIVRAVRKALPPVIPVSAKIRLGWDDPNDVDGIAHAVEEGGANWITIHARTKQEGYRPGVHWDAVARVKSRLSIPVVANGDLFSADDVEKCAAETGCSHFMVGRGILNNPFLAHDIRAALSLLFSFRTDPAWCRTLHYVDRRPRGEFGIHPKPGETVDPDGSRHFRRRSTSSAFGGKACPYDFRTLGDGSARSSERDGSRGCPKGSLNGSMCRGSADRQRRCKGESLESTVPGSGGRPCSKATPDLYRRIPRLNFRRRLRLRYSGV
jgi:tRNA-dihydrouridine synthase C